MEKTFAKAASFDQSEISPNRLHVAAEWFATPYSMLILETIIKALGGWSGKAWKTAFSIV